MTYFCLDQKNRVPAMVKTVAQFAAFFEAPKIATRQKYPDLAGFVANGLLGKPNDRLHPFTPYSSKETVAAFHRIPSVVV